jgi:hypothetical protein
MNQSILHFNIDHRNVSQILIGLCPKETLYTKYHWKFNQLTPYSIKVLEKSREHRNVGATMKNVNRRNPLTDL